MIYKTDEQVELMRKMTSNWELPLAACMAQKKPAAPPPITMSLFLFIDLDR